MTKSGTRCDKVQVSLGQFRVGSRSVPGRFWDGSGSVLGRFLVGSGSVPGQCIVNIGHFYAVSFFVFGRTDGENGD